MRTHELIQETATYNTFRITWSEGSGLDFHGHGDSKAFISVIQGELTEYLQKDGYIVVTSITASDFSFSEGLHCNAHRIVDKGTVHKVVNHGPGTVISIHTYFPPLKEIYDDSLEINP